MKRLRMRAIAMSAIAFLLGFCIFPCEAVAQVAVVDSLVLIELYNTTDGPNWYDRENWMTNPVPSWSGITVEEQRVTAVRLRGNYLSGSPTSALNRLDSLAHLDMAFNFLSGPLPSLEGLSKLQIVDLGNNQFSGAVPSNWSDLKRLIVMKIENNADLTGSISLELRALTELEVFWYFGTDVCATSLHQTWLSGIDDLRGDCISDVPGPPRDFRSVSEQDSLALVALYNATNGRNWSINRNWLTGLVSSWSGISIADKRVAVISLRGRNLVGQLPAELNNLNALIRIDLANNNINGPLPDLYDLTNLTILDLSANRFTGPIPESWLRLRKLVTLKIQNNVGLSGALPGNLTNLRDLRIFWVSGTSLCLPGEASFQNWMLAIDDVRISDCTAPAQADPLIGSCSAATGDALLDVNNVRARILNTGGLFYRGEPHVYNVPKFSDSNAIFAASIWIGGLIDDYVHVAATRYGPWEYWPGPLSDEGAPPKDCTDYDRMYRLSLADIDLFERTGQAIPDLFEWPTGLGAPTVDSTGIRIDVSDQAFDLRRERVIDLKAGERPEISGDEMIWWIMNDRGNIHKVTKSPSLGVEVHGSAFAASSWHGAINNTTLYRYRIVNRNTKPIDRTYFGMFVDPDLGDFDDDYVGSDSIRGLAFVYNADNEDLSGEGYGTPPPAVGIRVLEGPLTDNDGIDNNRDGVTDETDERPNLNHFLLFGDGGGANESPQNGQDYYNYLRTIWKNGRHLTLGDQGYDWDNSGNPAVNFSYPGDPTTGEFWSERNIDGRGTANTPSDRRFLWSTGPFNLEPGEAKELTFAIVWAVGVDHLDSVNEMKHTSDVVQLVYDAGFVDIPKGPVPEEFVNLVSPAKGAVHQLGTTTLVWDPILRVNAYQITLFSSQQTRHFTTEENSLRVENLEGNQIYFWRVRPVNQHGAGQWSDIRSFITGTQSSNELPIQFTVTQNGAGDLDPPDLASYSFNGSGFDLRACPLNPILLCSTPTRTYQQAGSDAIWVVHAGNSSAEYGPLSEPYTFLNRITQNGATKELIGNKDYEWRWIGPGLGGYGFDEHDNTLLDVGFELWNIGVGTTDDISDDYRMIPVIDPYNGGNSDAPRSEYTIGGDHVISPSYDDPFTRYTSWHNPSDTSPGDTGFQDYISGTSILGAAVFHDMVLAKLDIEQGYPGWSDLPETGTVFRITTIEQKPPVTSAPAIDEHLPPGPVRFFWSSTNTGLYQVQISRIADFSTIERDFKNVRSGIGPTLTEQANYYWRVKAENSDWSSVATFIIMDEPDSPADPSFFNVTGNYPNPFRGSTFIGFNLQDASVVHLEVFDILGQRIGQPMEEWHIQGQNFFEFDAGHLTSGVYFYTLTARKDTRTGKMVLAR